MSNPVGECEKLRNGWNLPNKLAVSTKTLSFANEAIMSWWWYENDALMPGGGMGMMP